MKKNKDNSRQKLMLLQRVSDGVFHDEFMRCFQLAENKSSKNRIEDHRDCETDGGKKKGDELLAVNETFLTAS